MLEFHSTGDARAAHVQGRTGSVDKITVERVSHRNRCRTSDEWVLRDVSLSVRTGDLVTIMGPSGAGKTTLLRLIADLEEPTEGRILLDGRPVQEVPHEDLRARVGMVFQIPALFEGTVADNVLYGPRLRGGDDRADAVRVLERVGLRQGLLDREASALSVGEQQRVALARALILRPEILLIDEPTSALDPASTARVFRLIRELNVSDGLTVIQVTHVVDLARQSGGEVVLVVGGKRIESGPAEVFFSNPRTEAARAFIDGTLE